MSRPTWFFDRDGVVNCCPGPGKYLLSWEAWKWSPGILELLQAVKNQGYATVLVTSQRGVGKGLMSLATLPEIHKNMQAHLAAHGVPFDGIYAYTALPECVNQPKPEPQMLHAAASDLELDLSRSWMIGDADRDIEMAHRAGVPHTVRVRGDKPITVQADHLVDTLAEVLPLVTAPAATP